MTEAITAPQKPLMETNQVKIAYLDRAKKMIRLIFLTGTNMGHNLEYSYSNADVDHRIRTGDVPIDAFIQGGKLLKLSFPPGMEPVNPVKSMHEERAKKAESSQPPAEKPKEEPPKQEQIHTPVPPELEKWQIKLLKKGDGKALIHKANGQDEWMQYKGKAAEKIIRLKEGQLVRLKFEGEIITDINPVDETGQYDKSAWGGRGSVGKGGYRQDPIIDLIRNYSILHEATLDKIERFQEFCLFNKVSYKDRDEAWNWIVKTSIKSSLEIYQEIEKKHKYGGQV